MRSCAVVPFVMLLATPASAATLVDSVTKDRKTVVTLSGDIAEGDADRLKQIIKSSNDAGRLVGGLRLNSPGGNLFEAAKLSEVVRYARVSTVVVKGATCASACFVVFASGSEKYANFSASIGVHGASDKTGRETVEAGAATVLMARLVKELGVPASIIGKMVVTPPEQMVWLTPDELRSMGATMLGKPAQVAPDVANHQAPIPPSQVPPSVQANTTPTWKEFVDKAFAISSSQNNGKPRVSRLCQPEFKICITGVYLTGKDGIERLLRTTEDMKGNLVSHEVCEFNTMKDVRFCTDWDTGAKARDMKDVNGNWIKVADD